MTIEKELTVCLAFAKKIAIAAGALLAKEHGKRHARRYKTRYDFALTMDRKADRFIASALRKRFPGHDIVSEEKKRRSNGSSQRWCVDPLDGTYNYSKGLDLFAVSIGHSHQKKPTVGVIYAPLQGKRGELYWASEGNGAFFNGSPISVSREEEFSRSFVALEWGKFNPKAMFPYHKKLWSGRRILHSPSYVSTVISLAWLASGKIEAYGALKLEPWDMEAAVVIVREAGGKVTNFYGKEWEIGDKSILAANPFLHAKLLKRLHT